MSDFYNGGNGGGGGGGGQIDPSSIPDEQNIFLGTNSWYTDGVPEKAWFQQPIAMFKVSGGANRIWLAALRKEYSFGANETPPFLINDSSQALKSRYLKLAFESYFANANHQATKRFLLLDIDLLENSDDGKFIKLKKISGGMWDYELDTPSSTPEIFEVYIDENDASNNKNVNYSNILASINNGKFVYLKVLRSDNTIQYFYYQKLDTSYNRLIFVSLDPSAWFKSYNYYIKNDNTYSSNDYDLLDYVVVIDERVTPPTSSAYFTNMKSEYKAQRSNDIILRYFNSNGDYYKLRAVKMNASETEIMFSIYDPDTARNLSIVVNDQNQYTVIT